jgi:hypothetical protein
MTIQRNYRHHATDRGSERYGLELTRQEYTTLSAQISFHELTRAEEIVKLCNAGDGRERWAVWFKGEWIPVVFDPEVARIVTILPRNELRNHSWKLPW